MTARRKRRTYSRGGRSQTLLRTLRVLAELSHSPWPLLDLAEHLGVAWRTLYRDVDAIRAAGIEVVRSGRNGRGGEVLYRVPRDSLRRVFGVR